MKKILFTAATSGELKVLKQEVKKTTLKNISVDFLLLGMGNYSTIMNLQECLIKQKYDFIINIGVCGYIKKYRKILQVGRIKNISNNKELIVPAFLKLGELGSIACSEKIMYSSKELQDEEYVDMESYGVELVCSKFQVSRIILKVPVDKIGEETKNFDFEKAKNLLAESIDYSELLNKINEYLEKNKVETTSLLFLQRYFEYYKMTFSEKLIFEKLYNKYVVLVEEEGGEKFSKYFERNKELNKKEFFKKLDEVY